MVVLGSWRVRWAEKRTGIAHERRVHVEGYCDEAVSELCRQLPMGLVKTYCWHAPSGEVTAA